MRKEYETCGGMTIYKVCKDKDCKSTYFEVDGLGMFDTIDEARSSILLKDIGTKTESDIQTSTPPVRHRRRR